MKDPPPVNHSLLFLILYLPGTLVLNFYLRLEVEIGQEGEGQPGGGGKGGRGNLGGGVWPLKKE